MLLRILRWGHYAELSRWGWNVIINVLIRGRGIFGYRRGEADTMTEAEIRVMYFDKGGRGYKPMHLGGWNWQGNGASIST